jgi:hypothetical protein
MRSLLTASALALLGLLAAPGTAGASAAAPVPEYTPGGTCSVLGTTHMAADNGGLVICGLKTANGSHACTDNADGCTWKSMSVNSPTGIYSGFPDFIACYGSGPYTGVGPYLLQARAKCTVSGPNCSPGSNHIVYYGAHLDWIAYNTSDGSYYTRNGDGTVYTDCAQSALNLNTLKNLNRTYSVYTQ